MSCSLWIDLDDAYHRDHYLFDGITYNLPGMFQAACRGKRFKDLEGMTGAQAGRVLRDGLQRLVSEPARFEEMNPANGWGDYDGLIQVMAKAAVMAARHPTGVVVFSG